MSDPGPAGRPVTVADVVAAVDRCFPFAGAESWDAVGLVVGDPAAPVSRVHCTVDVTDAVLDEAETLGAELVLAHHPLLLRGVHGVAVDQPKGRLVDRLVRSQTALLTAHTNADTPPGGTADVLAAALGLAAPLPLRPGVDPGRAKLTTFVPDDHLDAVRDALTDAGAGASERYDRVAYTVAGTGTFRPLPGARPFAGSVGRVERVAETRLEVVLAADRRPAVVAALLAAHPYEEPAYDVAELVATGPVRTGLGRVGDLPGPVTLAAFVERVATVLPSTPAGLRVAGDPDRLVRRVAVQAGAGDDLLDEARGAGAKVYLTSDLRHHPASEALAHAGAPALVEVSHWAAESLWLPGVAGLLAADLGVETSVSTLCTDPWTARR